MNSNFGMNENVESFEINGYKIIVSQINDWRGKYTAYNIFKNGLIVRVIQNDISKVLEICKG